MNRYRRDVLDRFYFTNIGRSVRQTLDWCLEERQSCFIEGREGRGKSASAKAWCDAHRGQARYVSLPGLGVQRDFFNALARAYGVPFVHANAPNQVRIKLRDVIVQSGLILVIDEGHHALPERCRNNRPPLIDWIDTELCNNDVPVCLISTPQFGPRLSAFEDKTHWNARQFKRRFSGRWCRLDAATTEPELEALVRSVLPEVGSSGIKLAVGYALGFDRDVSGLFDLIRDATRRARKAGRSDVTHQDLSAAYKLDRVPTENAIAAAFKTSNSTHIEAEPDEVPTVECDVAAESLQPRRNAAAAIEISTRAGLGCESEPVPDI